MPFTNRGKFRMLQSFYRGVNTPSTFYVALVTATVVPTAATNTLSQLAEIAAGNGYTAGGIAVARSAVAWDVLIEDDTLNQARVQAADIVWTPSGGPIPSSGAGATYAVLLDDNVTPANRDVIAYATLTPGPVTVSDTQPLTLQNLEFQAL